MRGATLTRFANFAIAQFRSTPPCGGRPPRRQRHPASCRFDPRPRAGGDDHLEHGRHEGGVSIHAPVRGATNSATGLTYQVKFRSTPPCGGRPPMIPNPLADLGFDPRPRAGGDCRFASPPSRRTCFDPRPRAGGDEIGRVANVASGAVSIHAPVRGATASSPQEDRRQRVSIHAPVRGATLLINSRFPRATVSIHAPVRGATSGQHGVGNLIRVSIHAPVRGATSGQHGVGNLIRVSIHAPVRGATLVPTPLAGQYNRFDPRPRAGGDSVSVSH